jgi:hypothetical protein
MRRSAHDGKGRGPFPRDRLLSADAHQSRQSTIYARPVDLAPSGWPQVLLCSFAIPDLGVSCPISSNAISGLPG